MVSPSKIFKSSNTGFKVVIDSSKKDGLRTFKASKHKSSSSSQGKNSRLLANTKFYLDIRNRVQLAKVESTLKSYGAKIEVFFRKDIKVVVTDRAEWIANGQSPTPSVSPLATPSPSSNQDQRFVTPKSRASAMLEKVSRQPCSPYISPLELAQKWRIPVLPIPSLWKWIAKIEEAFIAKLNEKRKEKELLESKIVVYARDSPFIKIESSVSPNIPEFLELGSWPRLNLEGHLGQCPFRSPSPPSPSVSDEQPKEADSKLFEVKNKVAVELIQYDTDFRIKDNLKIGECEEVEAGQIESPTKQEKSDISLNGVQCNGLTTSHRNSKLLSPSGSDVLPLPSSRRSTRRASASWCGSTRELSQLSPTDSEIENIRRSESNFEAHDPALDSPGITLRPKGQLWLPIALIGTTAEENGNCIRKRYEYSMKQSENARLSGDSLDSGEEKTKDENDGNQIMPRISKESDSSLNSVCSSQNEYQNKKHSDRRDTYCIITRNTKVKNDEINGRSRESSVDSHKSDQGVPKIRVDGKKRSFSMCGRISPSIKRTRTMSTNSVHSMVRKKKLSPEEKLLQDNKEYFKMEVLNTKLRSSGSLLNVSHNKELETNGGDSGKLVGKIDKIIIKKIKVRDRRRNGKWTKSKKRKGNNVDYATIILDNKKSNNLKINGVIKKKRQSELMKLCNEAESFMFGESSRHGSTTTNTTENELEESPKKKNCSGPLNKTATFEETSTDSNCENEGKTRKKRRSHAEAFIHDNLDYYKFETPGSRLRYQGSFLDVKSEDKDFIYTLKQRKKERLSTEQNKKNELLERLQINVEVKEETPENQEKRRNSMKPSEEVEKILFSFESIPTTEPWYEVYKRQDEGMENYFPLLSDPNDQPFLLPYELPKPSYPKVTSVSEYYKKRRKKLVHLFNHPRKSPRCHASTLAILSSLKRRKRRSGTNISVNYVVSELPLTSSNPPNEKPEIKSPETPKNCEESEEILNFLFTEDSESDQESVLLEPVSDSEGRVKRKNSDTCKSVKSDEDETKNTKTVNRSKKCIKSETLNDLEYGNEEIKHFALQNIKPDDFFKDMIIETRKKSGLNVNITTILDNFKSCNCMDDSDLDLLSDLQRGPAGDGTEKNVRPKKRKARKINKTGWDNRKSRRRTGNKISELKELESETVATSKTIPVKTKVKIVQDGINTDNIIMGSKKRVTRGDAGKKNSENEDGPVLRSHSDGTDRLSNLRRSSQDSESQSESFDSGSQDYPPCVVRLKKITESNLSSRGRLKCSNGRYALQKRRLILSRKKKRVIDYAWTTKRR